MNIKNATVVIKAQKRSKSKKKKQKKSSILKKRLAGDYLFH